ncbi:hypothetical protein, conserved [Eimeria tenella]|uniref:proline--tRNA ligase n=1 Tax=Eimeria tenella TaxID=5802 RepID=U6KSK3_EIMTE|nr:hypothetical protein, conserved [Eimeria tenella]CDJ41102.1 hypothetical protein, conserved [Eimeria tenella]|eukprot:XP_013231852.1 hypothetical protein, conserved [Eimeria tenella]
MAAEPLAAATYSQQASVVVPAASAPHRSLSMDSHHHPFDSSALAASFRQRANAKLLIPLKHKDYLRYIFMTSLWQRLASEPRPRRPFAHRRGAKHATCSRVNASAQALHRSRMLATADYLAGGLPRACLASKLPMPSGAQRESEWDKAVRNGHNQSPLNEGNSAKVMSETAAERESDLKSSCMEEGGDNPLPCPFNDRSAAASTAARSLEKARLIQATSSGLFCVLPLGFRVLKKIETVCHEELAGTGASPLSLPSLMPMEWLHDSDRVHAFGASLYKVEDRRARHFFLSPTSEEAAAWLAAHFVRSHKELPLMFYQIGPKFRDEARPRAGCLRTREFVMLEAYSFHQDAACRDATYRKMDECFRRILSRLGAGPVHRIQADPGTMGGPCSHEYHVCSILGSGQTTPRLDRTNESHNGAHGATAPYVCGGTCLEVGHCFQLPKAYCKAARARFMDSQGVEKVPFMSSYGLGVSRLIAHLALSHQDMKGLLFPPQVAPFCVAIIPQPAARWNDGRNAARLGRALFRRLHRTATEAGGSADVFLDDRRGPTLRQMQMHADLIGIPHQVIIKHDLLRTSGKPCVLYISRTCGSADILPLRAALNKLQSALLDVAAPK